MSPALVMFDWGSVAGTVVSIGAGAAMSLSAAGEGADADSEIGCSAGM